MGTANKLLQAASGGAGDKIYVEDVFSTDLYTGTGSTLNIVNGIDNSGEGGFVWLKRRDGSTSHTVYDTVRGVTKYLIPNSSDAEGSIQGVTAFNNNGYTLGTYASASSQEWVGWNWRKQAGFFDVQTYTGNGSHGHLINHDLGCIPGMIWIKRTDSGENWYVYHIGMDASNPEQYSARLDSTAARTSGFMYDGSGHTGPTATQVNLSSNGGVNANGGTFVMYLFAAGTDSASQIFGEDSDEAIIKCGSYTGNGSSTGPEVNVGFEPQFLIVKAASRTGNWLILDVMRGITTGPSSSAGGQDNYLLANSGGAEGGTTLLNVTSTGLQPETSDDAVNENSATYIYMAIRRPMKAPDYGTDVFAASAGASSGLLTFDTNFRVDFNWLKGYTTTSTWYVNTRVAGERFLQFNTTDDEDSLGINWDRMTGWQHTGSGDYSAYFGWSFKRAAKFLDIVAYTGNGSASGQVINHNLTVTPELIILKSRSNNSRQWHTYVSSLGQDKALFIEDLGAVQSNTAFVGGTINSTQFELKVDFGNVNGSGEKYIAYLFATLAGVSKVGSYSGTGSTINVDCGFSAGARLVVIKRTDDAGNWFLYDSVRGIVASQDPYLLLNSSAAQNSGNDDIDPLSSGFSIPSGSNVNTNGASYIFLAIA